MYIALLKEYKQIINYLGSQHDDISPNTHTTGHDTNT